MLIVRGVNVFPSAVREVVNEFAPQVSGHIFVKPETPGVTQDPPLPVQIELASGELVNDGLAGAIHAKLREVLTVRTRVERSLMALWSRASASRPPM